MRRMSRRTVSTMSSLAVRPMELPDFDVRVAYFHDASDDHLALLGVDRARLPDPVEWRASFAGNLALPVEQRSEYGVVWELDGELVGFSTADQIQFGVEAHMHLHIVDPERRTASGGPRWRVRASDGRALLRGAAPGSSLLRAECLQRRSQPHV